jgi:hypothetical protein
MMEFNSANKAYEFAGIEGFRTFVKGKRSKAEGGWDFWNHGGDDDKTWSVEPFGEDTKGSSSVARDMMVGMNEMEVQEVDSEHDLQTNVLYFTIPGEEFAALVRRTTFTNLAKPGTPDLELEVLDGQPKVVPAGSNDWNLKNMGRTMEAWMNVYNMEDSYNTEPFIKLSMDMADTAEVSMIAQGHWAISFVENGSDEGEAEGVEKESEGDSFTKLPFVVDPAVIFGQETSYAKPFNYFDYGTGTGTKEFSLDDLLATPQVGFSQPHTRIQVSTYLCTSFQ